MKRIRAFIGSSLVLGCATLIPASLFAVQDPSKTTPQIQTEPLDRIAPAPAAHRHRHGTVQVPSLQTQGRGASWENQLLVALKNNPEYLGINQTPPLRITYVNTVPGRSGLLDRVYVNLVQTANGADVVGTAVSFSFSPATDDLIMEDLHIQLYPDLLQADPGPGDVNGARLKMQSRSKSQRVRTLDRKVRWLDGRWRTVQEFIAEDKGLHGAVDGSGRTYLWDDRVYASYQGTVSGRQVDFAPLTTGDNLAEVPLVQLEIRDTIGNSVFTDNSGNYNFMTPSVNNITVDLSGKWSDVNDMNGTNLTVQITAGSPNPTNLRFNPIGNIETNTSQVNGYRHTTRIHDWLVARGVNPPAIDIRLPVNVNLNSTCNAYYDFSSINFYKSGGGCINTAFDTVIYHEYGHFVDDKIGGISNSGLSEGWGDVLAAYITGQPDLGEGFYGIPGSKLRTANNTYVYSPLDPIHTQGMAWSGFAWDLRINLINSLGSAAGIALAENLVIPALWANSVDIPAAVRAVALRDDDDNNLANGTPHWAAILAAANKHGVTAALDLSAPTVPTNVLFSNPTSTQMRLSWTSATDDTGVTGYRVDVSSYSNFQQLLANYNNANVGNVTQVTITGLSGGTLYYGRVRAYDSASNVSPHSAVAQGLTSPPDISSPTVSIIAPTAGATLFNAIVVSGTAADNEGVTKVNVLMDGVVHGVAVGTTTWTYALNTWNLANGGHTLSAQAIDGSGNTGTDSRPVTILNAGAATYSSTWSAPTCSVVSSVCNSGNLLVGRGNMISGIELNQPNTLQNSCADGQGGTFHSDESLDRLQISTLDGTPIEAGKTVKIEATVWAYSGYQSDFLDLFYTTTPSSPDWTWIGTLHPTAVGSNVLSTTYVLPAGAIQAIRANFRYSGSPSPCTSGVFDDRDDLVFAVQGDTTAPSIPANVRFSSETTTSLRISWDYSTDNGQLFGYHVDFSSNSDLSPPAYTTFVLSPYTTLLQSGLKPATTYYTRVRAVDAAQNVSGNSAVVSGVTSADVPVPQISSAQFISQQVPTTMEPGQTYSVQVVMKNNGTKPWTFDESAHFKLGTRNPNDNGSYATWGLWRVNVTPGEVVLPGATKTFNFNVTAPSTPETYHFQWQMVHEYVEWFGDYTPNVSIQVGPPVVANAQFISQQVPTTMDPGQTYAVQVVMKNNGTKAWTFDSAAQFKLGTRNPNDNGSYATWGLWRVNVTPGEIVLPGATRTFNFNVTAPTTPETYNFRWQMVNEFVEWFGDYTPNVSIQVGPPVVANAQFISQQVPTTMDPGQTYAVQVVMKNNGTKAWTFDSAAQFKLGTRNPNDNGSYATWGLWRVNVTPGEVVLPGATKTFNFNVTAPSTPETYNFRWQMVHEYVEWFGDYTPNVSIQVGPPVVANAQFISQQVPTTMNPGQTYAVQVVMKNSGAKAWTFDESAHFKLGTRNPNDNGSYATWGLWRVNVTPGEVVLPGATRTFNFNVAAPGTSGTYDFRWQMVHEFVEWFGDYTPNVSVQVGGLSSTYSPFTQTPETITPPSAEKQASGALSAAVSSLIPARVYPSPWRAGRDTNSPVTFDQVPAGSTVKIFTAAGQYVGSVTANGSGAATWDLKNSSGESVASGIYIYLVTDPQNNQIRGKFGLIR